MTRLISNAPAQHLIIGERRSATAIARDLTWRDGRLCADTLHRALRHAGIDPTREVRFENLFTDADPTDWTPNAVVLLFARRWRILRGGHVVALGRRVSTALEREAIPHRKLTHPAARGLIRRTDRYQAHVRDVLSLTDTAKEAGA